MNTPKKIFARLNLQILTHGALEERIRRINAVFEFRINGSNGGDWTLQALPEGVILFDGLGEMPSSCIIRMTDENFVKLVNGKLNLKYPWNWNKIQIEGDKGLAMKLGELFKT